MYLLTYLHFQKQLRFLEIHLLSGVKLVNLKIKLIINTFLHLHPTDFDHLMIVTTFF